MDFASPHPPESADTTPSHANPALPPGDERPTGCAGAEEPTSFGRAFADQALGTAETIDAALIHAAGEGGGARLSMGDGIAAKLRRVTRGPPVRSASLR